MRPQAAFIHQSLEFDGLLDSKLMLRSAGLSPVAWTVDRYTNPKDFMTCRILLRKSITDKLVAFYYTYHLQSNV